MATPAIEGAGAPKAIEGAGAPKAIEGAGAPKAIEGACSVSRLLWKLCAHAMPFILFFAQ